MMRVSFATRAHQAVLLFVCAAALLVTTAAVCVLVLPITLTIGLVYFLVSFTLGSFSPNSIEDIALSKMEGVGALSKFATKHRTPLVIAIVLPLSLLFDTFFYLRMQFVMRTNSAPDLHTQRVAGIQAAVRRWKNSGPNLAPMSTNRPGWMMMSPKYALYKDSLSKIDVDLYDVLEVDTEAMTVRAEPCVSMGQLSHILLPKGFTVPVLPEMDDLTVGGLVAGCGIESSSHLYGLLQATCVQFELVDANGELLVATPTQNRELFLAIPWSYGSLGFLVSVTMTIIPAKPYVRLCYWPFGSTAEYSQFFEEQSKLPAGQAPQFVEALVYSKERAVVMTGDMVDTIGDDGPLNSIGLWYKPWFFKHVETFLARLGGGGVLPKQRAENKGVAATVEYLPLRDYYHRHTRSIFWEAQDIIPVGNNPLFRLLFGWMMPPKVGFLKLTQTETLHKMYKEQHVIQDMLVPIDTLHDSIEAFDQQYALYPLWVCPMKLFDVPGFVQPKTQETMFVDIGAYGVPAAARRGEFNAEAAGKAVEKFVLKNGGFQMLYADSYLTRHEFRSMFDHSLLDKLRKKHAAVGAFPDVYDKVCYKPQAKKLKAAGAMAAGANDLPPTRVKNPSPSPRSRPRESPKRKAE
jgi:delta24-sterol reductase